MCVCVCVCVCACVCVQSINPCRYSYMHNSFAVCSLSLSLSFLPSLPLSFLPSLSLINWCLWRLIFTAQNMWNSIKWAESTCISGISTRSGFVHLVLIWLVSRVAPEPSCLSSQTVHSHFFQSAHYHRYYNTLWISVYTCKMNTKTILGNLYRSSTDYLLIADGAV